MPWKKAPPELGKLLDEAVAGLPCQKRPMFGYPVYFVHDNKFAGLYEDSLFIR